MTFGDVVTLIGCIVTFLAAVVTILKVFKSQNDKSDQRTKELVDRIFSTYEKHSDQHLVLTKQVLETVQKNTEAFNQNTESNKHLAKTTAENTKSNQELKQAVEKQEKVSDQILQNFIKSARGD